MRAWGKTSCGEGRIEWKRSPNVGMMQGERNLLLRDILCSTGLDCECEEVERNTYRARE